MNRVTRISSAAFGMLLLAGLAYYQTQPDPVGNQEGSLIGTALKDPPKTAKNECEGNTGQKEPDADSCENDTSAGNRN